MSLTGNEATVVSLHDTNTIAPNAGFEVSQDCTLVFRLRDDTADVTWAYFKAGVFYPHDIKLAKVTGSTAATTLLVVKARRS
jgi:hypothetical protein